MANYHDIRYNFAIPTEANVGAMTLIKTITASSRSTVSFVDGSADVVLDNTYPIYVFKFFLVYDKYLYPFFFLSFTFFTNFFPLI